MGIQGLLPLLKSIMVPIHINELSGSCVAVDTYSWLHKGALSCSRQLCKGEPTSRHIDYCMHRVNLLRHHGVKPILVFDGGLLPMKSEQETKRSRARKENLERAMEHESNGNSAAAYECYQKAVDISPSIASELILVLKEEKVDYVVAPYEADAQMTFLALKRHIDAVITEDSDLIPFGCPRIIFKMDKFGHGVQFQSSVLHKNKELNFTGFTKQMLLEMCILSGCDYLQSLPGMGLKRAHALVKKFKCYEKVIKHLRYNTGSVPPHYEESFKKALWTFRHQRVYDPTTEDIVHLVELPYDHLGHDLDYLGPSLPQNLAKGIAIGDIDPISELPFQQGEIIPTGHILDKSYAVKEFKFEREKKLDLPAQKNILTNYFCSVSLEAKKKFKVPRIISKRFELMEECSPSTKEHVSANERKEEHASEELTTINCSQGSLLELENLNDGSTPNDSMDDGIVTDESLDSPSGNLIQSEDARLLEQSTSKAVHSRSLTLNKEHQYKFVSEGVEGKTRLANRKVIVRSSYFQHKLVNEKNLENENEKLESDEDGTEGVICETTRKSALYPNSFLKSALKKRKFTPVERAKTEIVKVKHALANHPRNSDCFQSDNSPSDAEENKFGCNISHINNYSDIAEKSMERFVSVVSSFRCTSSGSRASGLRAPLKDVRNTLVGIRSPIPPKDLSKFSYGTNNRKTASVSLED